VTVDHAHEDHAIVDRDAAIARKADLLLHIRPVLPFDLTAPSIEREDIISSRGDVHHPVPNDRSSLHRIAARKLERPGDLHLIDVLRTDLTFVDLAIASVASRRQHPICAIVVRLQKIFRRRAASVLGKRAPSGCNNGRADQQRGLENADHDYTFSVQGWNMHCPHSVSWVHACPDSAAPPPAVASV